MKLFASIFFLILFVQISFSQQVSYLQTVPSQITLSPMQELSDFFVDTDYNYFFLDKTLAKIWVYDSNSVLIKEIPTESGDRIFERPVAMGNVDNEIVVLDADLKKIIFINKLTNKREREFSGGTGSAANLTEPVDMSIDINKNIFIIDLAKNKICKFDKNGLFLGERGVKNPIALSTDIEGKAHVLVLDSDGAFSIISFSADLRRQNRVSISNVIDPKDISVNTFGEFFIVDSEVGKVFRYGPSGNVIGEQIGVKSSSKGIGQFSDPIKLSSSFINNENDLVFVLDNRFNYVQSFNLLSRHQRNKLFTQPESISIILDKEFTGFSFIKFFAEGNKYFYVKENNSIVVRKSDVSLFVLNNPSITNISSITEFGNQIYVADKETNKIFVFSSADGSFLFSFGHEGEAPGNLNQPLDLQFDLSGLLYVADFGNNRVNIYSSSGEFIDKIPGLGSAQLINPIELTLLNKNEILILLDNDPYIYRYDITNKNLSQVRFPFLNFNEKRRHITKIEDDIIVLSNAASNVVSLYQDGIEIANFLSMGSGKNQIQNIDGLYYNKSSNLLLIPDNENRLVKEFKLTLATSQRLKIIISDLGYSELRWIKDSPEEAVKIFRKKIGEKDFQFYSESKDTSLVIFDNAEFIYDYALRPISSDGTDAEFSNEVRDEFSYSKSIKDRLPLVAIEYLKKNKTLNETVVNNQIFSIYRKLVDEFRNKQKYTEALNALTTMKSLRNQDYTLYIEKSNIYKEIHNYNEGIAELETAIDNFPNNVSLYYSLIDLKRLNKDHEGVITFCNSAISKFPGDEKLIASMALAYRDLKRYNEATNYYRMLSQQFGKEEYFLAAGNILIEQNKYDEAFIIFDEVKNSGNATGELYSAYAEAYLIQDKLPEALNQINEGLKIDPNNAELNYLKGEVYSKQGETNKAIEAYKKSVELDSATPLYTISLADELLKTDKKDDATFYYESAILLLPENVNVLLKLGSLYLEQDQVDYSYRYLTEADRLSQNSSEIKLKLDEAAAKRKEKNSTRESIEFNYIDLGELSHSLLEFYKNNPFGSVTVFNTRNEPYDNVVIEITCQEIMNSPVFISIDRLIPNVYSEHYFTLNISSELFDKLQASKKSIELKFTLKYDTGSGLKEFSQTEKAAVNN